MAESIKSNLYIGKPKETSISESKPSDVAMVVVGGYPEDSISYPILVSLYIGAQQQMDAIQRRSKRSENYSKYHKNIFNNKK